MYMRYLRSTFWIGLYFIAAAAPVLAMLIEPPPGRGFWREFGVAIGFAGLSMMGLQFFITGRFKNLTAPYGIDVVYHFHRNISLIAFGFILLHVVVLLVTSPDLLLLLHPASSPWWMVMGVIGLVAFVVVIISSLYRQPLGLSYELWRLVHGNVSLAAVVLSMAHVVGVGFYTETPVKLGLWLVMVAAWALALFYVRVGKSFMSWRRPYIVDEVRPESGRSWTLRLRPDGHDGMEFKPGQFAWLTLGKSPFAIREHPFSFSSSAMERGWVEMTIKELGDFTSQIGQTAPGTRAYLDGPYGSFTMEERDAPGFCFIAGGVGISPIMSMLRAMADRHDQRPVVLFYGSKDWDNTTFREELEALKERLNIRIVHVLSNPPPDWKGEKGLINTELMARHLPENRMQLEYFICGPVPMQKIIRKVVDRLGLPPQNIYSESFNFV